MFLLRYIPSPQNLLYYHHHRHQKKKRKKLADLEKEEYLANPPAYFMNKEHWSLDG
uniref:Uncharacterized protein n=1 Tax=viral metagenome TaxID=1070528 RepID=A0A6M3LTX4_9ZZZZ